MYIIILILRIIDAISSLSDVYFKQKKVYLKENIIFVIKKITK